MTTTNSTNVTLPTTGTLVNTAVTTLSSLASIGTITSGTWNATAISPTYGGTGVNNGSSTITLGGSLTLSGAFTTALTVTGNTAVTLPTSGTLFSTANATLNALSTYNTNGLLTQTSAGNFTGRTVTGTSNRISITNGDGVSGNPTIDIDAAYVGQNTITTLGTVTTGTWSATAIGVTKGGTGLTSCAQGDLFYGSASNTIAALSKDTNATRYLANTGTSNNPAWAQVALTTGVTGTLPVANGGTGAASQTAYAVLCGGTTSTGAYQSVAGLGSSGQVLTSNGASALPTFQPATGFVKQRVSTLTGSSATGTTVMPFDDTIPQNTEGDEYMTLAITPTSSSNILVIDVFAVASYSIGVGNAISMALFQDSTAGALAAVAISSNSSGSVNLPTLRYIMTAGTTSSTTFKTRIGGGLAGTITFNGNAGTRIFGGVCASSMMITEYAT